MSTSTFSDQSFAGLSFNNITITEYTTGQVNSLLGSPGLGYTAGNVPASLPPPLPNRYQGLAWAGFTADALAPGSTLS
ncbi:MAG TPA: hypothetical protein VL154_01700, partial [Acetobacteraceae bacterium]|nr:hypothetical protein [Acetobacteraceae bacterium]